MNHTLIEHLSIEEIEENTHDLFEQIKVDYNLPKWQGALVTSFSSLLKRLFGELSFDDLSRAYKMNTFGELNKSLGKQSNKIASFNVPNLIKIIYAYIDYKGGSKITHSITPETTSKLANNLDEIHKKYTENVIEYYNIFLSGKRPQIRTPYYTAKFLQKKGLIIEDVEYREPIKIRGKSLADPTNERLIMQAFQELKDNNQDIRSVLMEATLF